MPRTLPALAELGVEMLALDIDPRRAERLSAGRVPMFEPGLEELPARHVTGIEGSSRATRRYVIDGRNALDAALWGNAGWTYRANA